MFSSIKPKLDEHLFVDLGLFTNSYLFLPVAEPKLFCFDFQNNCRVAKGKHRNQQTIIGLSYFGLIEDNMDQSVDSFTCDNFDKKC